MSRFNPLSIEQHNWMTSTVRACYRCSQALDQPGAAALEHHYREIHFKGKQIDDASLRNCIGYDWAWMKLPWSGVLEWISDFAKLLCGPNRCANVIQSAMFFFGDQILGSSTPTELDGVQGAFVCTVAKIFSAKEEESVESSAQQFSDLLNHGWPEYGYHMGIIITCSLISFNDGLKNAIHGKQQATRPKVTSTTFCRSLDFAVRTLKAAIRRLLRFEDANALAFLYTQMNFICHLSGIPSAMEDIEQSYPWKLIAEMLNHLRNSYEGDLTINSNVVSNRRPLPDDHAVRNLAYAKKYFPPEVFSDEATKQEDITQTWIVKNRRDRILRMGLGIAGNGDWLKWDGKFEASKKYKVESVEDD